ncbi:MAG: glycosyltransferase family 4 protein [Mucilaginibacter polytrichastri]|nr:glycosyltransferase family 4 protein [Mucilaginibacter polytrichastri]
MRVLYDFQAFSLQKYGGISRYFAGLSRSAGKMGGLQTDRTILYSENAYLDPADSLLGKTWGGRLFDGHFNRLYRWNRRYARFKLKRGGYSLFHPTFFDPYFLDDLRAPFVVTVHDMIHELHPEIFGDAEMQIANKKILIENAAQIIAISEATRADIKTIYPDVAEKITVIHHGYQASESREPPADVPERFILFVGERWHYKNFPLFAQAIAPLLEEKDLHLLCIGGGSFSQEEKHLFDGLHIRERCVQINASEATLKNAYHKAQVFVFPSKYEGFGLPLLEAFAAGCCVACSDIPVFHEVADDAAVYFDPENDAHIRSMVGNVLSDLGLRRTLKQKTGERLALFPFSACVEKTVAVYKHCAKFAAL